MRPITAMLPKLYDAFVAEDAMLIEVNPLIVTPERELKALDAKVTLDGSAMLPPSRRTPRCATPRGRTRRSRWPRSAG